MNPKNHSLQHRFFSLLSAILMLALVMPAMPGAGQAFAQAEAPTPTPLVIYNGVEGSAAAAEQAPMQLKPPEETPPPPEKFIQSVEADDPALGTIVFQDDIPAATRSVVVEDNLAYFGDGSRLVVYDVTTPTSPVYVGNSDILANTLNNLILDGSTAYMALGSSGVWHIDVSDPANLISHQEEIVYPTPGSALKLALNTGKPKRIYVAAGSGHLNVLAPQRTTHQKIGSFPVGIASDVEVSGYHAFVTDQYSGKLRILDFSTTWKGKQVGSLTVSGDLNGLTKSGNYVYIASGDQGLRVIDVTIPASPTEIGAYTGLGDTREVTISGNYAYVAAGSSGLKILDISTPSAPVLVASYDTPGVSVDVTVSGSSVYIADTSSLVILQLSGTYSIQGTVTDTGTSQGLEGATVSATNTSTGLVYYALSAATSGDYTISNLPAGSYTVAAAKPGYVITAGFTNPVTVGPNATDKDFSATISTDAYRISGYIKDANNTPIANVTVRDAIGRSAITDANGFYQIASLSAGTYTITPVAGIYTFSPVSRSVTITTTDVTNQNFSASAVSGTRKISGYVRNTTSDPLAGVTVSDGGSRTSTTNASGYYELTNLPAGSYTLGAAKIGYSFTPSGWTNPVVVSTTDRANINFTYSSAPGPYTVSGQVIDGGSGIAGVTISASFGGTATSGSNGNYTITGVPAGSFTLTASLPGYTCTPSILSGSAPYDVTSKNFVCTPGAIGPYSVSGRVTDGSSMPIAGVTILLNNGMTAMTNAAGDYTFSNITLGTYTMMPTLNGYTFSPVSRTLAVSSNLTNQNFSGTATAAGTYIVSGKVTSNGVTGISGVSIYASNGQSTTSDDSGNYLLNGFGSGTFAVMPVSSTYTFSPVSASGSLSSSTPSATQNFVAAGTPSPYSISGRITDGSANPIAGVTMLLSNGMTTTTNANGEFSFSGLAVGSYTLMPFKSGYTFSPPTLTVYVSAEISLDVTVSFTGSVSTSGAYTVSGRITDGTNPVVGVTVYASNGVSASSDANGDYTLSGFAAGTFAVMPVSSGYTFSPTSRSVSPSASTPNVSGQDFVRSGGSGGDNSISGRVTDNSGNPVASVTISDGTRSATTDSSGNYTINNVPAGSYTLTPSKSGFGFSPASLAVSVPPNASGKDFIAVSQPTYTISGRIVDTTGDPVANVTLTDGSGRSTSTDGNGNYTLTGVPVGVYTLTPSKAGFTFTPATQIGSVPPNAIDRDFTALPAPTYTVAGRVADSNGDPLAEVTVMDGSGKMAVTDANGNYVLSGIPKGSYSLTASKSGYIFTPNPLMGSVPPNATKQNFTGAKGVPTPIPSVTIPGPTPTGPYPTPSGTANPSGYTISGSVRDSAGNPLSGATVSDGQGRSATTDVYGTYLFSGYVSGSYNVTAARTGYSCTPYPQLVTIPPSGTANFSCSLVYYAVSGIVMDANGNGIGGVTVSAGAGYTTTSDSSGAYAISVPMGTYVLVPSKTDFQFSPVSRTVAVSGNLSGQNFYGASGVTDVIVNGDFETDGGWVMPFNRAGYSTSEVGDLWAEVMDVVPATPEPGIDQEALLKDMVADYTGNEVLSGKRSLRVGIVDPTKNVAGYSEARQRVQVPWTSKITKLRFWLYPTGGTPDGVDLQIVSLLDHNQKQKERLVTMRSNAAKWQYYEFDLTKYRGQTLWVYFGVYNNGKGSIMGMYVDYVQMLCASGDYPPLPVETPTLPSPVPGPVPTGTPSPGAYSISGRVTSNVGSPLSGVTLSSSDGRSAVTNSNGEYVFASLAGGTYTITPMLVGAVFTPPNSVVTVSPVSPAVGGVNFVSSAFTPPTPGGTFSVSGLIKDTLDVPIGNVTISDGAGHTTVTNASGQYTLNGLAAGSYTIYPAIMGYVFSPASRAVTLISSNASGQDFTGTQVSGGSYTISGKVTDTGGSALADVNVSAGDGHSATTNSVGDYVISGLSAGSYVITPSKSAYAFSPVSRTVSLSALNNATGVNFMGYDGSYPSYGISGRVTLGSAGLEGVVVSDGSGHSGVSNSNGEYAVTGLYAGNYTLTAAKESYTFTANFSNPVTLTSGNVTGKDFIAAAAPTQRSNNDAMKAYYIIATAKPRIDGDFPSSSTDFPSPTQWNANKKPVTYKILGIDKLAGQDQYGVWDLKADVLFGWDEQYLYVFAKVYDNVYVQEADDYRYLYRGDSVEVALDREVAKDYTSQLLSSDDFRIGMSGATHNPANNDPKAYVYSPAEKAGIPKWVLHKARSFCEVDSPYQCYQSGPPTNKYIDYTGYMFEGAIEWSDLGITPQAGDHYGFAFSVSDNDQVSKIVQEKALATVNNANVFFDPTTWGDLELLQ